MMKHSLGYERGNIV